MKRPEISWSTLSIKEMNPEECDATEVELKNKAGYKKIRYVL
jgi:hypothetical protein